MTIKMIALDLDHTTLNEQSRLSAGNKKAMERAIEEGVSVVVATGRAFTALPEDVMSISGIEYIITSNGGEMRRMGDDGAYKVIYSDPIDPEALKGVISVLKQYDFMVETFIEGKAYIEKRYYDVIKKGEYVGGRHAEYVLNTRQPVEDLYGFTLERGDKVENINVFFEDLADKERMREVFSQIEDVTLTSSLDMNLEFGGKNTSKAAALKKLMEMTGLTADELMVCGDSPNDIPMLQLAGTAIAVGNAKPEVKEAATYVSASNDDDGVAEAIYRFVLGSH